MPDFHTYTKEALEYEVANPSSPSNGAEAAIHLAYREELISVSEENLSKAVNGYSIGSNPPGQTPPPPGS